MIRILFFTVCLFTGNYSIGQTKEESFSKQLNEYLTGLNKPDEPGMAVLVAKPNDHTIFSKGYGLADLKQKTPITPRSIFNLGSVSKTFVAYGILKLQEQGKLSIEDPIAKYFPGFRNKELVKDIRIKHLLSHTSGLPDNRPVSQDSIFFLTANDEQNWAPILRNEKLNFQPGERFEYSNPAFNGLALIIEKVSGQKWQDYIQQIIFDKAGMRTSLITDIEYPQIGVAHAYQPVNGKWEEYDFGEYPTFCAAGNGGVWSSVEELLKYEEAILNNKIVSPSLTSFSRTVFTPPNWKSNKAPFIACSWFNVTEGPLQLVGHSGDQGGFRAEYWNITGKNLFIAITSNGSQDLNKVLKTIIELLQKNQLL
jgi:CubicO group peptidase (beta-lactamase class C family)